MLPQRPSFFQQIGIKLINFISSLFGTSYARSSYAGFALESDGNLPGMDGWKMLEIVAKNQELDSGLSGYAALGWLVKFPTDIVTKKTDRNSSAAPESITQLVAKFTAGQVTAIYKVTANSKVPINGIGGTLQVVNDSSPAPIPEVTRHWITPFLSASHRYFNSVSIKNTQTEMKNFQYYQRHTQLVFFSYTQLKMVYGFKPSDITNHRLFFSGYEMLLGRSAMNPMMLELTRLSTMAVENPVKWFSLKLETINTEVYVSPNSPQKNPPQIDEGSLLSPFEKRGAVCEGTNANDDGIPFPHYGQPCPPEWDFLTMIMEETFRVTGNPPEDPCAFAEHLQKALKGSSVLS